MKRIKAIYAGCYLCRLKIYSMKMVSKHPVLYCKGTHDLEFVGSFIVPGKEVVTFICNLLHEDRIVIDPENALNSADQYNIVMYIMTEQGLVA